VTVVHCTAVAMLYGSTPPVVAVYADPAGDPPGQRWFSVFLSDGDPDDEPLAPVCVLLLDLHPSLGAGLDLAQETGGAYELLESGEWRRAPQLD
jgi:hypothetical protein